LKNKSLISTTSGDVNSGLTPGFKESLMNVDKPLWPINIPAPTYKQIRTVALKIARSCTQAV
tara:strand:+ start:10311 stop:10496 length:186 start_codon:yes stop_codon:yes gene_type:complete